MHKKILLLLLAFLLAYPGLCLADSFYVVKVYDGDTIKARLKDTDILVRLVGIDAPEVSPDPQGAGQPYSQKAKKFLETLVLHRTVDIKGHGYLGHRILLGEVYLEGKNINIEMARAGLCEVIRDAEPLELPDLSSFVEAEERSKAEKIGVWTQGDHYVSPRVWRGRQVSKSGAALLLYGILQQSEK